MPPPIHRPEPEEPRPTLRPQLPSPKPNELRPVPPPPHGLLRPVSGTPNNYYRFPMPMHLPGLVPHPMMMPAAPIQRHRPAPVPVHRPQEYVHREPYHPNFAVQEPYRPKFGQSETTVASTHERESYNGAYELDGRQLAPGKQLQVRPVPLGQAAMVPVATSWCTVAKAAGDVVHAVGGQLARLITLRTKSDTVAESHTVAESETEGEAETDGDIFYDAEEQPAQACDICGDEKPASEFVTERITAECTHSSTSCISCVETWLQTDLEAYSWTQATCPECSETLQYADIQRLASPSTFTEYDRILTRNLLAKDEDFRWCPNPHCTSGHLHTGGEAAPVFQCTACNYRHCIIHNTAWHEGETCTEFDTNNREPLAERKARQAKEEQASLALMQVMSKKCPGKGCDFSVQKIEGCDAMRCTRCQHKFCFQCLASYAEIHAAGNSAHKWSCAHYRAPGRLVWH